MSKEQPEAIIFEKIKRLCRNANCAYTVMNYYETVIIPEAVKAERERVIKDIEEWVRKDIRIEDCNCIAACEDKCETAGAFTEHCPWWQQLKQQEG